MKLTNVGGFDTIEEYVSYKLKSFGDREKNFSTLFEYMFSEEDNIAAEISDIRGIKKITYGELKSQILSMADSLFGILRIPRGSRVGIHMDNSVDFIRIFWAVLVLGYVPLLMNKRLPKDTLENVLLQYGVKSVISDDVTFSVNTIISSDIPDVSSVKRAEGEFGGEVIFMSSGTTNTIKLCAYTAENFYYQLGNSVDIVKKCPQISKHFKGELKILALLPFYHVFGFIAVYLWFTFFSRTLVFLNDMSPRTIQSAVKKHGVTHIFAVPLVWDRVYRAALDTAKSNGEKTYLRLQTAIKLSNKSKLFSKILYKSLGEVRQKLFGDSIRFLISGGGHISGEVLSFFNGIGYHLVNGYGMTEVGITSVEISAVAKVRNLASIGSPFVNTEYMISDKGHLLIRGKNMASRIYSGTKESVTDFNEWFDSLDLAAKTKQGYFLQGRSDDLIVSKSGENLNPQLIENLIKIDGADDICLFEAQNEPVLLLTSKLLYSEDKVKKIISDAKTALQKLSLSGEIHKICLTPNPLMTEGEFKISRSKISQRFQNGDFMLIDEKDIKKQTGDILEGIKKDIADIFAKTLRKPIGEITPDAHFFSDLGGTSIDYFVLCDEIRSKYLCDIRLADGKSLCTVNEICEYIKKQ